MTREAEIPKKSDSKWSISTNNGIFPHSLKQSPPTIVEKLLEKDSYSNRYV